MMRHVQVHKLIENTCAEGPGNRVAIWVQGCSLHCDGCYEMHLWDTNGGTSIEIEYLSETIAKCNSCEGVTILGGEPFEQAEGLSLLLKNVHEQKKNIVVFSGYTYEELRMKESVFVNEMLKYTDLLIDGRFLKEQRDFMRPLVGSINQRFIPLTEVGNVLMNRIECYKNSLELRIDCNGIVSINGMWV